MLFISPNAERLFMPTLPVGLALVASHGFLGSAGSGLQPQSGR